MYSAESSASSSWPLSSPRVVQRSNMKPILIWGPWSVPAPENEILGSGDQACRARSIGPTVVFSCPRTRSSAWNFFAKDPLHEKKNLRPPISEGRPNVETPQKESITKRLYMVEKARMCAVNADLCNPPQCTPRTTCGLTMNPAPVYQHAMRSFMLYTHIIPKNWMR